MKKTLSPEWQALQKYKTPDWFKDAKLGIFIHWGVYAVPAFSNEWYPRNMYLKDSEVYKHHVRKWGNPKDFGYKDFIPLFKAEKFDPYSWVDLFKRAGARYIVPVAEHHDGFAMYNSACTPFNAASMGPCRDIVKELEKAVRSKGLKFGVSSHRAYNYHFYTFRNEFDNSDSRFSKLYGTPHPDEEPVSYEFVLDWFARTTEVVDRFLPDLLWFDFGWHRDEFEPWRSRVASYYYTRMPNGVLNYKEKFPEGIAVLDIERGKLDDIRREYWQTDTSISYKSWSYIEDDEFRSTTSIVHDLVDIVSKNGNLLLNIGPKADGTIPDKVQSILLDVGSWLAVNSEAIYGTRHWECYGEGPTITPKIFSEKEQKPYTAKDIRFTCKDNTLYAICLGWPGSESTIKTLGRGSALEVQKIKRITMLGDDHILSFSQDKAGFKIKTPEKKPCEHAYTFKIEMKKG